MFGKSPDVQGPVLCCAFQEGCRTCLAADTILQALHAGAADAQTNRFTHLGLKSVNDQSIGHLEPLLITLYLTLPATERAQTHLRRTSLNLPDRCEIC